MAALLWIIAAGALCLLASAIGRAMGDRGGVDARLMEACCLAAFGLCVGSLALV